MSHFNAILGQSPELRVVIRNARKIAETDVTVLIKGETGTGKELLATAIQQEGPRANKPFVTLNCAAISKDFAEIEWESQLFGQVKGAFTGAINSKQGLIQGADGGTLFFAEINSLPLFIQPKLLRFLETGECLAVGGANAYKVNVRVIAATNTDLYPLVAKGTFRRDLFFRLNIVPLELPPLRQRKEDILLLADYFLADFAKRHDLQAPTFSQQAISALRDYAWPGNIRELRNLCERLIILFTGKVIEPENLPFEFKPIASVSVSPKLLPEKFPPAWASVWGEDDFGLFAELHYQGQIQRFRWILPGRFQMGSPPSEPGREPFVMVRETKHMVVLSKGFWLADTACTQGFWQTVMGENPSYFSDDVNKPVDRVNWYDVHRFIYKLNSAITNLQLRLPSEAEWEYACRAGTESPFSFGKNITPKQVNYQGNYPYTNGEKGEYRETTIVVKSLPANAWGLYEMHGNVWEWCQDGSQDDLGSNDATNPLYDPKDYGVARHFRGGSWDFPGSHVRSAIRNAAYPDHSQNNLGFRLALG